MYGARSIQALLPQYVPMSSAVKESATSGALPARIDLMILSSSTPPTFLTVIHGWEEWKVSSVLPRMPSSRPVNPLHMVMVTGVWSAAALAGAEAELLLLPPLPPQAARAAAVMVAAAMRGTSLDFTVPPVRQRAGRDGDR